MNTELSAPAAQSESLTDAAYEVVSTSIASGALQSGTVLKESELSRALNMSRMPISLALQQLEREGHLRKRQTQGYVVGKGVDPEIRFDADDLIIPEHLDVLLGGQPTWERIYESAEAAFLEVMPFGQFRIVESAMAEHFNVNRGIIQQIIAKLIERGIAEKPKRSQCRTLAYDDAFLRHLYELRIALEPVALRLAAPLIEPSKIKALIHAHEVVEGAFGELAGASLAGLESQLHLDLLGNCPNPRIISALRAAQLPILATIRMVHARLGHALEVNMIPEHLAILQLLDRGSVDIAADLLRAHLVHSQQRSQERLPLLTKDKNIDLPPFLKPGG